MPIGVYIHIPFCDGKCPYCDFYSMRANDELKERYTNALIAELEKFSYAPPACDTIYIGGGTPLQLGEKNLVRVLEKAVRVFGTPEEFTVEVNPTADVTKELKSLAECGVNRISIGMQSAVQNELYALGRRHTPDDVLRTMEGARKSGIDNISLDIMVGIPHQTGESLEYTARFAEDSGAEHISAYMLKIEPNTPFYERRETLGAADDDFSSELYEQLCKSLAKKGYEQYEISNFAKDGRASMHNLKYWRCEQYLGFGCAAHSFFGGERFYHPRDIEDYINNFTVISDGAGGDLQEYIMLGLRLCEGINLQRFAEWGADASPVFLQTVKALCDAGLAHFDGENLSLTRSGFLVSNQIITRLTKLI